jgi:biopolymer transport protein ExbD
MAFGRLRLKRRRMLVEPPAAASSDIAFNLIVFFLVCASNTPHTGHPQAIPRSEQQQKEKSAARNVEVSIAPTRVLVNADPVDVRQLAGKISGLLAGKTSTSDRVVLVRSNGDTSYERWIEITRQIERGGGIVTLQLEEEKRVELK